MQLALIGGTGDIGEALALRLARDADVDLRIGSRDAAKAEAAVDEYREELDARGFDHSITGADNRAAARGADVVVLSVPPYYVEETVEGLADELGPETILVSPAVGMSGDEDGLHYKPPAAGSVAELVADAAPDEVPVVGACTNLSAERFADLDEAVEMDALVFGDATDAKATVRDVLDDLDGLRTLDAGPLANAPEVESLTPLLINVARYNDELDHAGVRFV